MERFGALGPDVVCAAAIGLCLLAVPAYASSPGLAYALVGFGLGTLATAPLWRNRELGGVATAMGRFFTDRPPG